MMNQTLPQISNNLSSRKKRMLLKPGIGSFRYGTEKMIGI